MTTTFDSSGLIDAFTRARNAGVPLLGIETADQPYTCTALTVAAGDVVAVLWDSVRGITALNGKGDQWIQRLQPMAPKLPKPGVPPPLPFNLAKTADFATALDVVLSGTTPDNNAVPEDAVVFAMQAHRMIEGDSAKAGQCVQAVINARELLKERGATLVLLGPGFRLPSELAHDVMTLSEALPGEARVVKIVEECYVQAGLAKADKNGDLVGLPTPDLMTRTVDATLGLSTFAIEQIVSMSLSKAGVNTEACWDRKIAMIEQTEGLSVYRGNDTFERLHGCEGAQEFVGMLRANWSPRVVLWWDEIEKAVAGYKGDNTGVSQDAMGTILSWTDGGPAEGREVVGLLLMGGPGTGKSQFAKCCGSLLGVPTVKFDTGSMQTPEVGGSQRLIRGGLKVIDAVGQGRVLMVATCNGIDNLPPELRRRFRYGLYYFDLPSTLAQGAIWQTWRGVYAIDPADVTPFHDNWTGAEIKACCEIANRTKQPLKWAARKIVSLYRSNPELVEGLRVQAATSGFIDATTGDPYTPPSTAKPELAGPLPGASRKRNIKMES